jgi:hypothetical protein
MKITGCLLCCCAALLLFVNGDLLVRGVAQQPVAATPGGTWTREAVEQASTAQRSSVLRRVRLGRHAKWDRVVFEFSPGAGGNPGYKVEYASPPFRLGESDETVKVAGSAFLAVRVLNAQAHTDAGRVSVIGNVSRLRTPLVRELRQTYDFEGQVEYIIGLQKPGRRFRVFHLAKPSRLVIDVER